MRFRRPPAGELETEPGAWSAFYQLRDVGPAVAGQIHRDEYRSSTPALSRTVHRLTVRTTVRHRAMPMPSPLRSVR